MKELEIGVTPTGALVRDKDGNPVLDKSLSEYPPAIRADIEAQMTDTERKAYADINCDT